MRVSEVMTRSVKCIGPQATLQEAAAQMKALDIGTLPVCDNDRPVGIITDRDITVGGAGEGEPPSGGRGRGVMPPAFIYCCDDALGNNAPLLKQQKRGHPLRAQNSEKRVVGFVSNGREHVRSAVRF